MELRLQNGDYVPDGKGGFLFSEGAEEVLERVLFLLEARRGAFPPLPNVGSRLYLLPREKPSLWRSLGEEYVAEALREEPGLTLANVAVTARGDGGCDVAVQLEWKGQSLGATVGVKR